MRHADIVDEINAKVNEICKLLGEEIVLKARGMEPIPLFIDCRPERGTIKHQSLLAGGYERDAQGDTAGIWIAGIRG